MSAANIQVSRAAPFPETLRENLGPCSLRLSESSSLRLQDGRPCLAAGCRLASLLPEAAACPGRAQGPPFSEPAAGAVLLSRVLLSDLPLLLSGACAGTRVPRMVQDNLIFMPTTA